MTHESAYLRYDSHCGSREFCGAYLESGGSHRRPGYWWFRVHCDERFTQALPLAGRRGMDTG